MLGHCCVRLAYRLHITRVKLTLALIVPRPSQLLYSTNRARSRLQLYLYRLYIVGLYLLIYNPLLITRYNVKYGYLAFDTAFL